MDEASGVAIDRRGTNTLTDVNGVGAVAGVVDGARVGGPNVYLQRTGAVWPTGTTHSLAFWFNVPASGSGTAFAVIAGTISATSRYTLLTVLASGALRVQVSDAVTAPTYTVAAALGSWHHAVVARDGLRIRIYLDGVLAVDTDAIMTSAPSSTQLRIGGIPTAQRAIWLDSMVLDSRAWGAEEVAEHRNGGAGMRYP
jgi:hypothetical protein